MFFRKLPVVLAAASLAVSSVAVQAAPTARDSAPVAEQSEIGSLGGVNLVFIAIAAAVLTWALIENLGDDDDAVSP